MDSPQEPRYSGGQNNDCVELALGTRGSLAGHQKPDVKATFTTNYAMKVAFTSSQSLRT
jgi:hypothetical protein